MRHAQMTYLLEYLPDAYLQEMARYFATQQTPFPSIPKPNIGEQMRNVARNMTDAEIDAAADYYAGSR